LSNNDVFIIGGCGCSDTCKPFATPTPNFHCGAPPMPLPLCYREECPGIEGTKLIPMWHATHPLIPMATSQCAGLAGLIMSCEPNCCDDRADQILACELANGELNTSTCGFPGTKYFDGVILFAAAKIELKADHALWMSSRMAAAAHGYNFTMAAPKLTDQPSWQLREQLKVTRFVNFSNAYLG
jgi:hypothetical protein